MAKIHADIKINGIVQGVGFRPFIYKNAVKLALGGWIRNTKSGVDIAVEGEEKAVDLFLENIKTKAPRLALIETVEAGLNGPLQGLQSFEIIKSRAEGKQLTWISPDTALCDDCLREMNDPSDRRYEYPFINCTNCGPRFTIIKNIPYDRASTTMAGFEMCPECAAEYSDPMSRRYHAQPDCCPECGPKVFFKDAGGVSEEDAIGKTRAALKEGKIAAVKGLGGFHLACLADNAESAAILRQRKQRDEKPFAIMVRDVQTAEKFARVTEDEKTLLESFRRPIVLLEKKDKRSFLSISENGYIGVMLPYTPLHYLLFRDGIDSLIMTSANLSDKPIMYKNDEAFSELEGIADCFLYHNRDIETRCDDSLIFVREGREYFLRRSRGYVPLSLKLNGSESRTDGILACGAEQKASFVITRGDRAFPSQHIGDLKNFETFENYSGQIRHFENLFETGIRKIVCDLHPDYISTEYAGKRSEEEGLRLLQVQHHHAHMASCMADNGLSEKCIGIIWDGTGLGEDGTIWGGEFLVGDLKGFERKASIRQIKLPGGDRAVKEIWRVGEALLEEAGITDSGLFAEMPCFESIREMLRADVNCVPSSGMGRLFDGVCAICGIKKIASYEGQGAVLLEYEVGESESSYPYAVTEENGLLYFETAEMIKNIYADVKAGRETALICADFMNTLTDMAADICKRLRAQGAPDDVVLSGGCFQNMYILERLSKKLTAEGFNVYTHRNVSANDEGISFGQAAIAAAME